VCGIELSTVQRRIGLCNIQRRIGLCDLIFLVD